MADQENLPLFYKNPVPLNLDDHGDMALNDDLTFDFAKQVNAVPLNMVELPYAVQTYPIAFTSGDGATPVAILGLRQQQNLFVDEDGLWEAGVYIPAYIRRYPFILAQDPNSDQLTLCVDQTDETLVEDATRSFFDGDDPSELTQNALEFCKSYQAAATQTMQFSKLLEEADILKDRHAEVQIAEDNAIKLSGFRLVDEEKFRNLPEDTVANWHQEGWMRFIYAQLLSTPNWQMLYQRLLRQENNDGNDQAAA